MERERQRGEQKKEGTRAVGPAIVGRRGSSLRSDFPSTTSVQRDGMERKGGVVLGGLM